MNTVRYILRSIIHYRRTHLAMALCIALASAVIIGALAAGDSVNATLRRNAAERLGRITAAHTGDRFFRSAIADDIARDTKGHAAPVLSLGATASSSGGRSIAVHAYGVDRRFWSFASVPAAVSQIAGGEVRINRRAAAMLGVTNGDTIILRVEKPGALPADMPFRSAEDSIIPMTLRVVSIVSADALGDFSLSTGKAPASVFLDIDELGKRTGKAGRADMIVADVQPDAAAAAIKKNWILADAGIRSVRYSSGIIELRSERVFIDEVLERAARNADARMTPVLGYFVNGIRCRDRETPYSFAASAAGIASNTVVINRWLADDIRASAGSEVTLSYYAFDASRRLVERSNTFTVSAVIDVNAHEENRGLMPDIEGLSDTANCRDWKPGMPVDLKRIRKKDEDYWNRYRGTPKVFVSLEAARSMWKNDFGSVTALRFPPQDEQLLTARITGAVDPAELGFRFTPVRDAAMKAARGTVDFGQLFLGLGIFIVAAALMLAVLIASLAVERRVPETAALRALGFKPARIMNMFIVEHAAGIVIGALSGILFGLAYVAIIVYALNSVWYGAVAGTEIMISVTARSIVVGAAVSAAAGILAMAIVIRRSFSKTIHVHAAGTARSVIGKGTYILFAVSGAGLIASLIWGMNGAARAEAFFSAGTFVLITVLAGLRIVFGIIARDVSPLTLPRLALRQAARKTRASITAAALIACGLFITIAVAANRHDSAADAHKRSSGTGGFALFIETSIPVAMDLNDAKVQRKLGVSSFSNVSFVPVRVREGDDASCLNLNRAALPPLYGIRPDDFESHGAFTFAGLDSRAAHAVKKRSPWGLLNETPADGVIHGIVDDTVLTWGLAKKLGDVITYQDEHGRPVDVRIVATLASSLLQGGIIVSGRDLAAHFPSSSRAKMFLVDANAGRGETAQLQEILSRTLRDYGAAIVTAPERLMMFSSVEHTYLSIFLSLGAFGLMLGTAGLGIVLLRTLDERRGERALMNALGFSHRAVIAANAIEQFVLLAAGVAAGLVSALIAVVPSALSRSLPWTPVLLCVVMVAGAGAVAVIAAVRMSVRPGMMDWLRNE